MWDEAIKMFSVSIFINNLWYSHFPLTAPTFPLNLRANGPLWQCRGRQAGRGSTRPIRGKFREAAKVGGTHPVFEQHVERIGQRPEELHGSGEAPMHNRPNTESEVAETGHLGPAGTSWASTAEEELAVRSRAASTKHWGECQLQKQQERPTDQFCHIWAGWPWTNFLLTDLWPPARSELYFTIWKVRNAENLCRAQNTAKIQWIGVICSTVTTTTTTTVICFGTTATTITTTVNIIALLKCLTWKQTRASWAKS